MRFIYCLIFLFLLLGFSVFALQKEKLNLLSGIENTVLVHGKEELKKHKVVFTGIVRDDFRKMLNVIRYIEDTGSMFNDYRVIVAENDSKIFARMLLNYWSKINPRVKIINKVFNNKKRPSISFLARMRNEYLEELYNNPEYNDYDTVIIVDMDMKYGWDVRGILDSFYRFDSWDVSCSNGIYTKDGKMWDMFAFRDRYFPHGPNEINAYWSDVVPSGQKVYPFGKGLVPVNSCFGGMAIYKKRFFDSCLYKSINEDCEHVEFHKCLSKNGARIFMNSAQIVRYSHFKVGVLEKVKHVFLETMLSLRFFSSYFVVN